MVTYKDQTHTFNSIIDTDASNVDVLNNLKGVIKTMNAGSNIVMLVYGQSGSGKTFTLMGREGENSLLYLCMDYISREFGAEQSLVEINAYQMYINGTVYDLSLIHISEPTRLLSISYAVFCLKKKI